MSTDLRLVLLLLFVLVLLLDSNVVVVVVVLVLVLVLGDAVDEQVRNARTSGACQPMLPGAAIPVKELSFMVLLLLLWNVVECGRAAPYELCWPVNCLPSPMSLILSTNS